MFAGKQRREYAAATPATSNLLGWQAGFTAGIIYELMCRGLRRDQLLELGGRGRTQDDDVAGEWVGHLGDVACVHC